MISPSSHHNKSGVTTRHRANPMRPLLLWIVLLAFPWNWASAQTLSRRPERPAPASSSASPSRPAPTLIPLSVPTGTPLKVALDQEVRVRNVGQPVHGKVV